MPKTETAKETIEEYPRGYRLDAESMNTLRAILHNINETTSRKITETRLIKALIWLSREIQEEEILKALQSLKKLDKKATERREYPRSYRFEPEILNALKETLSRVDKISPKKVGEAKLIKALVVLSKQMDQDKMIKALKEVW